MIMCVLLCYPVSIRIYYPQGVLFLVVNKYCHHISYLSFDWPTSSTIDQSDDSFQNVAVLFSGFCNSSSAYVVQAKQSTQLLTKEICLLLEFGYSCEISVLFVKFVTRLLHRVPQAKQSKKLLTKEICL